MTLSEELAYRGFVNQTTFKDLSILDKEPISFYWGVDPSADSMTVGNLAAAMMVKLFINYGHKAVLLIGGATGLIGDPDGKKDERNLKSQDEINQNKSAIVSQYQQLFGDQPFQLVDNYDWFKDINYLDYLREVGKHVPMRQMLARDFIQSRLGEDASGISYAEFSYVLIQAYDFLHLYKDYGVTLQVCGADQWGNSIAGVDLIRRKENGQANVYSVPLIIDENTGRKFGKSEAGAVWLDPIKTTPTQFYQFWINVSDQSVEKYLKIFSDLDKNGIEEVMSAHQVNLSERLAQTTLAKAVTTIVHGEEATNKAQLLTDALTGKKTLADLNDESIDGLRQELKSIKTSADSEIAQALVETNLASSKTDARKLISGRAISINGQRVERDNFEPSDFINGRLLIRRGKAFKDSALVELG